MHQRNGFSGRPWRRRAGYVTDSKPPEPRPYRPATPRASKDEPVDVTKTRKPGVLGRLFPSLLKERAGVNEPRDIARGLEASRRVVTTGILDPRYRPAARRITAAICAAPIMIYLSYELYERRFGGKEQKVRPMRLSQEEDAK